jgi:acyl-CoA dehydrogenase
VTADPLLLETAERVFAETCTHEVIEAAERDGWAPGVWAAIGEVGLPWVGVPEDAGGVGGTLDDALGVLRVAGAYAAPVPLAETGLLAGWLLASAGLTVPGGPASVVPGDTVTLDGGVVRGQATGVPWAASSEQIVVLVEDAGGAASVAVVPSAAVRIEPVRNLAGEPRDTVDFDGVTPEAVAPTPITRAAFERRGALTRIVLTAGALEGMQRMTLGYTAQRQQFGRPVARFQLVQAHLVHLAQDAALLAIAADAAARAAGEGDGRFEIAAAKALACSAATSATRSAHQAHGAMGMTREYSLHHLSRRLWSWRSEYGDEHRWNVEVGARAAAAGADALYPLVAG